MEDQEIVSNSPDLLTWVWERQKLKFGETTPEELYKRLRCEILELQEARRAYYMSGSLENAENIMFEEADIIILANRLYLEFNDEIGWALVDKFFNFETARYVKKKWEIVEQREYVKDENGDWQQKAKMKGKKCSKKTPHSKSIQHKNGLTITRKG